MTSAEDSDISVELLARATRGDIEAFATFVQSHEPRVASVIGRILDDPRDVAEATQDAFVQVWRNLDSFRGDAAVSTWLYRIATNAALMRTRKRSHRLVNLDDAVGDPALVIDSGDAAGGATAERVAAVRAALSRLPADQRAAVVLRDIEGFSTTEAAQMLDIPEPALKTRLHRGRMRLRVLLADRRD
ncbi:MAG: RNA polymerase sigma factor [Acidimicrobiia bacterium]